ncbi:MAG TPA: molybdopterin biosynthesis protein, partial [Ignisphaera sp.]|nr:molybdopterin biosynthesis protein [Ignisphaera sp.]
MERKIFHTLVSLNEVISIINKFVPLKPLGVEEVDLNHALGRVLAEDVVADIDYPPFDRSEVDGYAVRAEDTFGANELNPVRLKIIGRIAIGEVPTMELREGQAIETTTGSMIPRGANAVIMEEFTEREDSEVIVYRSVAPRENIAVTGSDIPKGDTVLMKGSVIGFNEIAILAAIGRNKVKVFKRPRIAVISIGNEIIAPGTELSLAKLYDINGYV